MDLTQLVIATWRLLTGCQDFLTDDLANQGALMSLEVQEKEGKRLRAQARNMMQQCRTHRIYITIRSTKQHMLRMACKKAKSNDS